MSDIRRPRGTEDITRREVVRWRKVEETAREVCRRYAVQEMRTPMFEHTELFLRGVGDTSDIVEKEMYTFTDKGGRSITLRPEGTAGIARAVLENKLYTGPLPLKLYYMGPMFRYERPGAGRLRQHHQFGIEILGCESPAADAEAIGLAMNFYTELGITELTAVINSVGCEHCRPRYREALLSYVGPRLAQLCEDCNRRAQRNPLRILDCKVPYCKDTLAGAPKTLDFLCAECRDHFANLTAALGALGLSFAVDPKLVRGIDYYTRTVFEIMHGFPERPQTVCAGGRYNGLLAELGGPDLAGVGFGCGLERALLLQQECGLASAPEQRGPDVYVIPLGKESELACLAIMADLRREGMIVDRDFLLQGLRSALKRADRLGAKYALIIGEKELESQKVQVKDLTAGTQEALSVEEFLYRFQRRAR